MLALVYLSIAVVTGFQAQMLLRKGGPAQRLYTFMLLGDMALALWAVIGGRGDEPSRSAGIAGAIAIGAFVCLVMLPRTLNGFARRAISSERLRLAMRLLDLRELLQPGLGARQERDYLSAVLDVREGRVDKALESLRAQRQDAVAPHVRRALDERVIMTLLYARRWREAIDAWERTRGDSDVGGQLVPEIVRAYGELGELERAAELLARLEASPASREPALSFVITRARMVYLAFVGRPTAVEAMMKPAGPLGLLPPSVRLYWIGTARLHAGDREGARTALGEALQHTGRDARAREITEERLAAIDEPFPELPRSLPAEVESLADRVSRLDPPAQPSRRDRPVPRLEGVSLRSIPVTLALLVANVVAAVSVAYFLGSSEQMDVLVRAGANVGAAVRAGELWRLLSSTMLHVGAIHLVLNMYGLWVLGRLMEQILGSTRLFVIYTLAGIGGAAASAWFGRGEVSAGASGAVFGLFGAAIAELALRRASYPERWRRFLLGNLLFLVALQLGIGFFYPMIDQSAHIGGLVSGAVLTAVLAPGSAFGKTAAARGLAAVLALALVGAYGWATWMVARTSWSDSLARTGWTRVTSGNVSFDVPRVWMTFAGGYQDPTVEAGPTVRADAEPASATMDLGARADDALAELIREELGRGSDGGERVVLAEAVDQPSIEAPADWVVRELRLVIELGKQHTAYRETLFLRRQGSQAILLRTVVPERRLSELAPVIRRVVESARWERSSSGPVPSLPTDLKATPITPVPARDDGSKVERDDGSKVERDDGSKVERDDGSKVEPDDVSRDAVPILAPE